MRTPHGVTLGLLTLLACGSTRQDGHSRAGDPPPPAVTAVLERLEREKRAADERCAQLSREGDGLLAAGKREEAIAAYDRSRARCPGYAPLRRQLFLARRPPGSAPQAATGKASPKLLLGLIVEGTLGGDLEIVDKGGYLDGFAFPDYAGGTLSVGGVQELHVELSLKSRAPAGGAVEIQLVDVREQFIVHPSVMNQQPLLAAAVVRVTDRQDGSPTDQRLSFALEILSPRPLHELQRDQQAFFDRANGLPAVMVAPGVGTGLRITKVEGNIPVSLRSQNFWTMLKVCVGADGRVQRSNTIKPSGLPSEAPIHDWVKTWQYRSYVVEGVPRPFCHPARLEVRAN